MGRLQAPANVRVRPQADIGAVGRNGGKRMSLCMAADLIWATLQSEASFRPAGRDRYGASDELRYCAHMSTAFGP